MAGTSAIEWTGGTWNVATGCTKVSPGCARCYIDRTIPFRMHGRRFERVGNEETTGVRLHPERLDPKHSLYPTRLKDPIFVCSLSDLFHEEVPDEFLLRVFAVMAATPERTFQVLTKRPERARDFLGSVMTTDRAMARLAELSPALATVIDEVSRPWPLPNVWLGVSIENSRYTWRADVLREIPAAVRFLSCEPLLGSLFRVKYTPCPGCGGWLTPGDRRAGFCAICAVNPPGLEAVFKSHRPLDLTGIDWVIAGGESGPGARPMHPDWARELRDACVDPCERCDGVGVAVGERHGETLVSDVEDPCRACGGRGRGPAFFFKQWGEWGPSVSPAPNGAPTRAFLVDGPGSGSGYEVLALLGKKRAGRELDGRTWDELPRALRVAA